MNRNGESRFNIAPQIEINRSKFPMSKNVKTSFNNGQLVPFLSLEVLPGDTFQLDTAFVCRMATPIYPTLDNCFLDTYYFFVPNRQVWKHWKEFQGENTTSAWTPSVTYVVPEFKTGTGGVTKGSILDHFNVPKGIAGLHFNALPLRAFIKIYNDWFRSEALVAPLSEYDDDTDRTTDMTAIVLGGPLPKVAKFKDYLTSALPEPQRGDPITIPLGTTAPVIGNGKAIGLIDETTTKYGMTNGYISTIKYGGIGMSTGAYNKNLDSTTYSNKTQSDPTAVGLTKEGDKSGMIADLSAATAATINALRLNFAMQKLSEAQARGGGRYFSQLKTIWGVDHIGSLVLQRPEYLGGKRTPINITQVAKTASTDSTSPQGNLAGFSQTVDGQRSFTKSFTEHGWIIGVMCSRTSKSYQQNLERSWSRRNIYDYYNPKFAHLGEQAIKNKEIYAQGDSVVDSDGNIVDNQTFGFQERWAEYRYMNNEISGELNSTYSTPLDSWHYGDKYNSLPVLSQSWIEEPDTFVARTLAVQNHDQFIIDMQINVIATRPMPLYSVPGLIDHM